MGNAELACPGVWSNGIYAGKFSAGLNLPRPGGAVPTPLPLRVM